jgi:hypothetical protein
VREESDKTYPPLGQLTGTLVLAVSEQFDDSALIWGETIQTQLSEARFNIVHGKECYNIPRNLLDNLTDKGSSLAEVALSS